MFNPYLEFCSSFRWMSHVTENVTDATEKQMNISDVTANTFLTYQETVSSW